MNTTNFPNGITNNKRQNVLGDLKNTDPTSYHTFFNDFDTFDSTQWNITTTEAGAGSSTEVINNEDGGILLVTNDDADNDNDFIQLAKETFKFESGKKLFFKARFRVSDATESDFAIGLQITDTSPLSVSDGVFFQKDDGDALLDFYIKKDSTATTSTAIATIVDNTYITVGFLYDGSNLIKYYAGTNSKNPTELGNSVVTNLPDDEEMTISFGIQNGEAVAKSMSIDYIFVAKER